MFGDAEEVICEVFGGREVCLEGGRCVWREGGVEGGRSVWREGGVRGGRDVCAEGGRCE